MIPRLPPRRILVGLALTVALDAIVQILWKQAAMGLPANLPIMATLMAAATQPLSYVIVALFVTQLLVWLNVLEHADLSYLQPITSLSYIGVIALSAWFLHEPFSARKGLSVALILAGVWLIGLGPVRTRATDKTP